jgi:hypothetical protein
LAKVDGLVADAFRPAERPVGVRQRFLHFRAIRSQ